MLVLFGLQKSQWKLSKLVQSPSSVAIWKLMRLETPLLLPWIVRTVIPLYLKGGYFPRQNLTENLELFCPVFSAVHKLLGTRGMSCNAPWGRERHPF